MATRKQQSRKTARRRHHQEVTRAPKWDPIPGAVAQLRALQAQMGHVLEACHAEPAWLPQPAVRVRLDTAGIHHTEYGLDVGETEEVYLVFGNEYPNHPPRVFVEDDARFVGFPHVICARELCVYLEPQREWHPAFGADQIVDRVLRWFEEAASGRFDSRTSLFHAVGGANPATEPGLTSVIFISPPVGMSSVAPVALIERSASRVDLIAWRRAIRTRGETRGLAFFVPSSLPYGLGGDAGVIAHRIEQAGGVSASEVLRQIQRAAAANRVGQPVYLCLVVSHPTETDLPTVVIGRIGSALADRLREQDAGLTPRQTRIEWMQISDERPTLTTPRDNLRPAAAFRGASVEIWGCGGLGSWIGEFIARARPAKLVLRDPAFVHRGLLMRQNYRELDVGALKAGQLAARLDSISDATVVSVGSSVALSRLDSDSIPKCDLIVDATINETIAYRLDQAACYTRDRPLLAQVAVDMSSGSLGLVIVAGNDVSGGPNTVDLAVAEQILADGRLEPYHPFWSPPDLGAELNPSPGCSTPTYHGSAADLAATAGTMVSLLGQQFVTPISGAHLFAGAHSGVQPALTFRPYNA